MAPVERFVRLRPNSTKGTKSTLNKLRSCLWFLYVQNHKTLYTNNAIAHKYLNNITKQAHVVGTSRWGWVPAFLSIQRKLILHLIRKILKNTNG